MLRQQPPHADARQARPRTRTGPPKTTNRRRAATSSSFLTTAPFGALLCCRPFRGPLIQPRHRAPPTAYYSKQTLATRPNVEYIHLCTLKSLRLHFIQEAAHVRLATQHTATTAFRFGLSQSHAAINLHAPRQCSLLPPMACYPIDSAHAFAYYKRTDILTNV